MSQDLERETRRDASLSIYLTQALGSGKGGTPSSNFEFSIPISTSSTQAITFELKLRLMHMFLVQTFTLNSPQ
jgi:hypothetical protein